MKIISCTLLALLGLATIEPAYSQVISTNGQVMDLTALRLAASQSHHGRTNHTPFVPSNATKARAFLVAKAVFSAGTEFCINDGK